MTVGLGLTLGLLAVMSSPPTLSATSPTDAPVRLSVIIGYDGPEGGERPVLSYADDDAARTYLAALQESDRAWLLTTFDADSTRIFPALTAVARPPTKEALAHVLGEAFWRIRALKDEGRATELVFSFAGHGDVSPAGEGFLVLADGTLSRSELAAQVVRGSPADVNHIWIDACASYFMVSARGGDVTTASVPLTPALLDLVKPTPSADAAAWARTGVLVSTSDSSAVHESGELGAGVFSYLMRSALSGAADVDADGRIEYAEAAAFIAAASSAIGDPRARLKVHAAPPAQRPHAPLGDLSRGSSRRFLSVDVASADRVRILDEHGLPYADVHRGADKKRVLLALQGSAFYVVQVGDREATLVPRSAGAYALSSLRFAKSPRRRGASADTFASLFERPYDRAFFDGWLSSSSQSPPLTGPNFDAPWASGASPETPIPWGGMAVGAFSGAGVLAVASVTSAAMNLVAFNALQQRFADTATLDPELSLQVEAWRTSATVTGALAVGAGLAGAGLLWASTLDEDRP